MGAVSKVWLVDLDRATDALFEGEAITPRLSPGETASLDAITNPDIKRLRRAAYIARRLVLERMFGASTRQRDLPRDRYGRPELPPGFTGSHSLSHVGPFALIAASLAPRIGVDLESPRIVRMPPVRRAIIQSAARTLSPDSLPIDDDAGFLQAWTRLEALAKADGRGIGHLLTMIGAVGGSSPDLHAASALAASHALAVHDLPLGPGLTAAIVTIDTVRPAVIHGLDQFLDL